MMRYRRRIRANLEQVHERISRAADSAGRRAGGYPAGRRHQNPPGRGDPGGDRRRRARILAKTMPKKPCGRCWTLGSISGVSWHMIGHVQSRKARLVCEHFDLVHSLDSLKLAGRYEQFAAEAGPAAPGAAGVQRRR